MIEVFKQIMKNTHAMKREFIRQKFIEYYMSLGGVSIPAFILAEEDIKLLEKRGKIEEWYKRMQRGDC